MAERTLPLCATCGERISAGTGWVRDPQGQPIHGPCADLQPACALCSKPIRPKTGLDVAGRLVHVRCLARERQLQAMAERDRAEERKARSRTLVEQTREAIARAKGRAWHCARCGRPLEDGSSLLVQGDELVHASCWRSKDEAPSVPGL